MNNKKKWLETDRLVINHPSFSDYDEVLKLTNNDRVSDYIKHGKTPEDIENVLKRLVTHYEKNGFSVGSVYLKKTNDFIGRVGLIYQKLNKKDRLFIIYHLLPEFWNKGYGFEAVKSVINYGFQKINSENIFASININNTPSIKLIKKFNANQILAERNQHTEIMYYEISSALLK